MIKQVARVAVATVLVVGGLVAASAPASAGCVAVSGDGYCDQPSAKYNIVVTSPTQICYEIGCINQGDTLATVPGGGQFGCIHIDYICTYVIQTP